MKCPCCSDLPYAACCKPYHDGAEPSTPLALMRSRYSAYALGLVDYIQKTTHSKSPHKINDKASIETFCKTTKFLKLEIFSAEGNQVHFCAHLEQNHKPLQLTEKSNFEQENSHWRYVDGEVSTEV